MSEKTDKLVEELGYKPAKTKIPQTQNKNTAQGRDGFQTPNYAVNLLLPFIPKETTIIWECAAGLGKISNFLIKTGYKVSSTDINLEYGYGSFNFLKDHLTWTGGIWAIITNPPFSLKQKFYEKCLEYKVPFALLIPADYSGWIIEACRNEAEKIIPTRRIDYLTPNILQRIHEGELWRNQRHNFSNFGETDLGRFKKAYPDAWNEILSTYPDYCLWNSIYDAPADLLSKYSSSDFHSMWLTHGFNLGRTETFVELSLSEKKNNI